MAFNQSWYSCHVLLLKRVHARGGAPKDGAELRGGAPKDGAILFGECRTMQSESRSSALSLLIIINLGFFAIGGGADIIVVIGFSQSYDSGLCCFIGSIIPRGLRPRTAPYCSDFAERCDTASQQSVAVPLNAPRMWDTGSSP